MATIIEDAKRSAQLMQQHEPKSTNETQDVNQSTTTSTSTREHISCYRCGGSHLANKCRFIKERWRACGKMGHIARVCRSKNANKVPTKESKKNIRSPTTNTVDDTMTDDETNEESDPVYTLPVAPIKIQVMANGHDIEMELDTGAAVSLMSERTFHKIFKNELELKPSTVILRSYSGHRLEVLVVVDLTITHHAQTARLPLVVVTGDGPSLLGRNWLQLIKLDWGFISLSRGSQETHGRN